MHGYVLRLKVTGFFAVVCQLCLGMRNFHNFHTEARAHKVSARGILMLASRISYAAGEAPGISRLGLTKKIPAGARAENLRMMNSEWTLAR